MTDEMKETEKVLRISKQSIKRRLNRGTKIQVLTVLTVVILQKNIIINLWKERVKWS